MATIFSRPAAGAARKLERSTRERRGAAIVVLAALVFVFLVWSAAAVALVRAHAAALQSETRVLERMSLVVEEQVRYMMSTVQTFLRNADQLFLLRPHADPRHDPEFLMLVDGLRRQSGGQIDIRLVNAQGQTVRPGMEATSHEEDEAPYLPSASEAYGPLEVGRPMMEPASRRWMLPVSWPLSARPLGMQKIIALIDSAAFQRLYEEGRTKPDGSLALVHRDGTVFARAPFAARFVGKSIAAGQIWTEELPRRRSGTVLLPSTVIDASERLTTYVSLPDFPMVVIASSSMPDVLAGWQRSLFWIVGVGLIFTLLASLVAWRLVRLLAQLSETRARAEDQALRDTLTGLPNRRMFQDRLSQALKLADRNHRSVALLFIDLDLFKEVNDTMGHSVGDLLLKDAATRLLSCVRESDTIARLGGDEFTIIMSDLSGPMSVERVAETVLSRLTQPFRLGEEVAWISASIGVTFYPEDAGNAEDLLKNADQAMYVAKREGRNRFSYFTPSLQVSAQNRKRLLDDLRTALASEQFVLFYQPILDLRTGRISKAEALIRWQHPVRGLIPPNEFIPVLEETSLMSEVGDWVFQQAAVQARQWRQRLDPQFQVSINKSPAQFRNADEAMVRWERHLHSLGLPGEAVAIEITEGLLMDVNESTEKCLMHMARAGMSLSMDDFGTGYSSLSYLKKFDVDTIKIDKSFVDGIEAGSSGLALCEAMIVMAHKLGLKVTAEGVEKQAQRELLTLVGCDHAQGYLISPPLPADEFEQLLARLERPRMASGPSLAHASQR